MRKKYERFLFKKRKKKKIGNGGSTFQYYVGVPINCRKTGLTTDMKLWARSKFLKSDISFKKGDNHS